MEYLAPGVYVEEIDTGAKPIEGVSTSTAGLVGVTERGPVDRPILITSFGEFRRWFGEVLDHDEFSNANGPHCFLPHAVEGFFANGGQRVWVTRILRDDALRSSFELRDRGQAGGFEGRLLVGAQQGTGGTLSPPAVTVLDDGTGLGIGDGIRVGDGGSAEYHTVATFPAASERIPLPFPTASPHLATETVRGFERVVGAFQRFEVTVGGSSGDSSLEVRETNAGDAAALILAGPTLVEIGGAPHAEYRIATPVAAGAPTDAVLNFTDPLVQDYDASVSPVEVLPLTLDGVNVLGAPINVNLTDDADAGSTLLAVDGALIAAGATMVHIDPGGTPEVYSIAQLQALALEGGVYADLPAGTVLRLVTSTGDDREVDTSGGGTVVPLTAGGFDGLAPGMEVVLDPDSISGGPATLAIRDLDDGAGTVEFRSPAPNLGANIVMRPIRALTAAADEGSVTLSLDHRLGLAAGDLLEVGTGGNEELVMVAALTGDPDPANPGPILLEAPKQNAHAAGEPLARQVITPAPSEGTDWQTVEVALDAAEGDAEIVAEHDAGFGVGDLIEIDRPAGRNLYQTLEAAPVALTPVDLELGADLELNHAAGEALAARAGLLEVVALDPGGWGNRVAVAAADEDQGLVSGGVLAHVHNPTEIELSSITGVEAGTVLEISGPAAGDDPVGAPVKVDAVNPANGRVTLAANLTPGQDVVGNRVRSREFRLLLRLYKRPDPTNPARAQEPLAEEQFFNLSMDPRHSRYVLDVVGDADGRLRLYDGRPEGQSWLVRLRDANPSQDVRPGPEVLVEIDAGGDEEPVHLRLRNGNDSLGMLDDGVYVGLDAVEPLDRTGLQTFQNRDDISIVSCPGRTGREIQDALISHCENMRYRFAVLDGPAPAEVAGNDNDTIADVLALRQRYDTRYAALYHPWLLVTHPYPPRITPEPIEYPIPPSGHMAGVYARVDVERGVHKAPANEVVRGIIGLRRDIKKREQDVLNPGPANVNAIMDMSRRGRGLRVFGARVITSDTDWKYVNVRRLMIFIEASLDRGLQWVTFEPNSEPLWARVVRAISNFLTVVWRNGALEGTTPEEAFFVRCDRSTMTQTDIDNGRLIAVIGVAPVKPAEYVIVRIGLWTAHADN